MSTATWNETQHFDLHDVTERISHAVWTLVKYACLTVYAFCSLAVTIVAYPIMVGTALLAGMLTFGGFVLSFSLLIEAARHIPTMLGFS